MNHSDVLFLLGSIVVVALLAAFIDYLEEISKDDR